MQQLINKKALIPQDTSNLKDKDPIRSHMFLREKYDANRVFEKLKAR